jgi:hypothetical protein
MSPFQGFAFWLGIISQGFALGFLIFPLRGKFLPIQNWPRLKQV